MKGYKQVVAERYDGERGYDGAKTPGDNLYALHRPVGQYGLYSFARMLSNLVNYCLDHETGKYMRSGNLKVLDIGSGNGKDTALLREFLYPFSPKIHGMDLAKRSIEECKKRIPDGIFRQGDIVEGIPFEQKFHIITAMVVFMHLNTEEEIACALKNISDSLEDDGCFMWYEGCVKDHFASSDEQESYGYSLQQMDDFARQAGMERVFYQSYYRFIPGKENTVYYARKFSIPFLEICAHLLWFFPPGNHMCIYRKIPDSKRVV